MIDSPWTCGFFLFTVFKLAKFKKMLLISTSHYIMFGKDQDVRVQQNLVASSKNFFRSPGVGIGIGNRIFFGISKKIGIDRRKKCKFKNQKHAITTIKKD